MGMGKGALGKYQEEDILTPFKRHMLLGVLWKIKQTHLLVRKCDDSAITSYLQGQI